MATEPVTTAAAIAITVSDGKLLVALPEAVWRRTIARRKLRRDALTKPALVAVAGCLASKRGDEADIVGDVRAWIGYLAGDLEDLSTRSKPISTLAIQAKRQWCPLVPRLSKWPKNIFLFIQQILLQESSWAMLEEQEQGKKTGCDS